MIRLATVSDYPAVSDLLNTYPSFSARPKEFTTMLLSASSKLSFMFAMKVVVVVDSHKRIVGCLLLDEGSYFLHAEAVCIAAKMNWKLMLTHICEYLSDYAKCHGYPGYAITVSSKVYAEFIEDMGSSFSYSDYHRGIADLRKIPTPGIDTLTTLSVAEFNVQRKLLADFAKFEFKLPIYLTVHDYSAVQGTLDLCQGISADRFKAHDDDFLGLLDFVISSGNAALYLSSISAEKLVIFDRGRAIGYAFFRNSNRHTRCIELIDFFVLPKYVNTAVPGQLLLAVGQYGAARGARFMCGKCVVGAEHDYMKRFFDSIGMIPDEYTSVFAFEKEALAESEAGLNTADSIDMEKTSVFNG